MVAYTWFNRLMALRFMDANGYTITKSNNSIGGHDQPGDITKCFMGAI
jgi:hypothetical protein